MSYRVVEAVTVLQMTQELEQAEREGYRYLGTLAGQTGSVVIMHLDLPQWPKDPPPCTDGEAARWRRTRPLLLARVAELLREAVGTDGGHHKQWYLEQIAKGLEVALPDHKAGIAP